MKDIVRNYFWEAKWCHEQHVPTMEEYMPVALVTSAYKMLATTSFVGMGEIVTIQAFEWLFTDPNKMVQASLLICRLMNDTVSHKVLQFIYIYIIYHLLWRFEPEILFFVE